MPQNLTPAEEELPEEAETVETAGTGTESEVAKEAAGTEAAEAGVTTDDGTVTADAEENKAAGTDAAEPETMLSSNEAAERPDGENLLEQEPGTIGILVYINGEPVRLSGKSHYIFVDIFDFYPFDLKASNGRSIITNLNGQNAQYSAELKAGDQIELAWK